MKRDHYIFHKLCLTWFLCFSFLTSSSAGTNGSGKDALAQKYLTLKDYKSALVPAEKYLKLVQNKPPASRELKALLRVASIYHMLKRNQQAEVYYRRTLKIANKLYSTRDPEYGGVLHGIFLFYTGQYTGQSLCHKAERYYSQLLKVRGEQYQSIFFRAIFVRDPLARCFERKGLLVQAQRIYKIIALYPEQQLRDKSRTEFAVNTLLDLARGYRKKKMFTGAEIMFQRALYHFHKRPELNQVFHPYVGNRRKIEKELAEVRNLIKQRIRGAK